MSTGIKISAKVDKPGVKAAAAAVIAVLQTADECRADQETVRLALTALSRFGAIDNMTVSGCNVRLGDD